MKKGFTLIELLAVIVILAIISLIATPIVLNIISDSRRASHERSIDNFGDALSKELVMQTMRNETKNIDNAIENVKYEGSKVDCNVRQILSTGAIYLNDCSVDGVKVENYSYGTLEVESSPVVVLSDSTNKFTGITLDKTGNIGLDLYANVDENSHIAYYYEDETIDDAEIAYPIIENGKTYFKMPISISDGSYLITVKLYSGDTEVDSIVTSLKSYCEQVLNNPALSDSHELVKALVVFGAAAQIRFNSNTSNMIDTILDEPFDYDNYKIPINLISVLHCGDVNGELDGAMIYGSSLSYNATLKINPYIIINDGNSIDDIKVTFEGKEYNAKTSSGMYKYTLPINYLHADYQYKVTFKKGEQELIYINSPMCIFNSGIIADGHDKELSIAAIHYWEEANKYYY